MWREIFPPQDHFQCPAPQHFPRVVDQLVESAGHVKLDVLVELATLPFGLSLVEAHGLLHVLVLMEWIFPPFVSLVVPPLSSSLFSNFLLSPLTFGWPEE